MDHSTNTPVCSENDVVERVPWGPPPFSWEGTADDWDDFQRDKRRRQAERKAEEKRQREIEERRREDVAARWSQTQEAKHAEELEAYGIPVAYVDAEGRLVHDPAPGCAIRIALSDRRVGLVVDPKRGGEATLTKLGLDALPETATIGGRDGKRLMLFQALRAPEGESVGRVLGPGLVLKGRGLIDPPDGEGVRWIVSPDKASIVPLPRRVKTVEPIPQDEDEDSRGDSRRIRVTLDDAEPPASAYGSLVFEGCITALIATPGVGKSMSATAIGADFIKRGEYVVYYDGDGNGPRIGERLAANGLTQAQVDEHFRYYDRLTDPDQMAYHMARFRPALVVFDNLTKLFPQAGVRNENDNIAVAEWFGNFPAQVKGSRSAVLILDHPAKNSSSDYGRAAGAKFAEADLSYVVKQPEKFNSSKVGRLSYKLGKNNIGVPLPSKPVIYRAGGSPFVFEPVAGAALTDQQKAILDCLADGSTSAEWLNAAKSGAGVEHNNSFYRAQRTLINNGFVDKDEDGLFHAA